MAVKQTRTNLQKLTGEFLKVAKYRGFHPSQERINLGVRSFNCTATRGSKTYHFCIVQHRCYFDPVDFLPDEEDTNHFYLPPIPQTEEPGETPRSIICFNRPRTWAVIIDEGGWFMHQKLGGGWILFHRNDIKVHGCPYPIWDVNTVPEHQIRGWPMEANRFEWSTGSPVGIKPHKWTTNPGWSKDFVTGPVLGRIPNQIGRSPMHQQDWYKKFFETGDRKGLPWVAF